MKKCFIIIFALLYCSANSAVLDRLKKIDNKTTRHSLRNIDFIYMINLDQRPEKFQKSLNQLLPYGIHPYRFSAVNGWELNLETINDIGLKFSTEMEGGFMASSYLPGDNLNRSDSIINTYGQAYFCHTLSRGCLGIVLSHLSLLKDAYDSNYQTIWIMEDDIEVVKDPTEIPALIDNLDRSVGKGNWDILYTDRDSRDKNGNYVPCAGMAKRPDFKPKNLNQYYQRTIINKHFEKIGARFGAYSMILRRSGIEKILNFYFTHQIFLPYDMDLYLPVDIKLYNVMDDVVTNLTTALSDNKNPYYLNKQ